MWKLDVHRSPPKCQYQGRIQDFSKGGGGGDDSNMCSHKYGDHGNRGIMQSSKIIIVLAHSADQASASYGTHNLSERAHSPPGSVHEYLYLKDTINL